MKKPCIKGVTLLELLVAVAITVIVGASIVGALYSGRSAWQAGESVISRHQNARAAIEFISRDLHHAYVFPDHGLGDYRSNFAYTLATDILMFTAFFPDQGDRFRLVRIAYSLDSASGTIERGVALYDIDGTLGPFEYEDLAWDIGDLSYTFYSEDYPDGTPEWLYRDQSEDTFGNLPRRVEISITPSGGTEAVRANVRMPGSGLRYYVQ